MYLYKHVCQKPLRRGVGVIRVKQDPFLLFFYETVKIHFSKPIAHYSMTFEEYSVEFA